MKLEHALLPQLLDVALRDALPRLANMTQNQQSHGMHVLNEVTLELWSLDKRHRGGSGGRRGQAGESGAKRESLGGVR